MPPWEKYRSASDGDGPWAKHRKQSAVPQDDFALAKQVISEGPKTGKDMLAYYGKPTENFGQYAGRALKEMAIPMATTAVGGITGGLPGAMAGSALGETVNQASGIYGKSVMPGVDQPDMARIGFAGAAPAIFPAAAKVGQGVKWVAGQAKDAVKHAVEPLTERGRDVILARLRATLAKNNPALLKHIADAAETAPQYVKGSKPTAGQAISHIPAATGFAAHEQHLSRIPGISAPYTERIATQEAARSNALAPIAGTADDLAAAITKRADESGALYRQAYDVIFDAKLPKSLAQNPYIKQALPDAMKLAQANKIDPKTNMTEFLHFVKIGLDKQLSRTGDLALHHTEKAAVQTAKENLLGWLKKKNPLYDEARQKFADLSRPINKLQVGTLLKEKLDSPLESVAESAIPQSERAAMFAKAIQDAPKTIKTATGSRVAQSLEDILPAGDMQKVEGIAKDLARAQAMTKLAQGTRLTGTDAVPGDVGVHLPNLLYRPAMIANFIMKKMGRGAEDLIAEKASAQHLNPKDFAKAIRMIPSLVQLGPTGPSRYDMIVQELLKRQAPLAAGAATQMQP